MRVVDIASNSFVRRPGSGAKVEKEINALATKEYYYVLQLPLIDGEAIL